ncbi:MAG: hypothetical protein AAF269_10410 [Pseudomonadota bacterium]
MGDNDLGVVFRPHRGSAARVPLALADAAAIRNQGDTALIFALPGTAEGSRLASRHGLGFLLDQASAIFPGIDIQADLFIDIVFKRESTAGVGEWGKKQAGAQKKRAKRNRILHI